MARMSIDDKIGRDPRIALLAQALGWSKRELVGCLVLDVWPLCYDQESHVVSERIIDAAANHAGFAQAMIDAELATRDRSGKVSVTGAKKRIKYLKQKKESGSEGGRKSAESRRNRLLQTPSTVQAQSKQTSSTPQAPWNPSVPDSASASASVPDMALVPDAPPESKGASRTPSGPHQHAVDEFHRYYQRTHEGSSPTWKGKNGKLMHDLVVAHGYPEVSRRIRVLESSPPRWPPPPWDMPTFSQHFDKISSSVSNMSGLDYAKAVANGEIP